MKKGRFCFNHPTVFSEWEEKEAAQYDCWEAHSSHEAKDVMIFPMIGENENGTPIYGAGKKLCDQAIIHEQLESVKHTPICCFRAIEKEEVKYENGKLIYTLGETAKRIRNEFGHDSFVLIQAVPFIERIEKTLGSRLVGRGSVIYKDVLNDNEFPHIDDKYQDEVQQLFRKDIKYEWQKEYRLTLQPSKESRILIEIGSIEDIAISRNIDDLES